MPKMSKVSPGGIARFSDKYISCVSIRNDHPTKDIYVRQYKRSIRVSDRVPASYGIKHA